MNSNTLCSLAWSHISSEPAGPCRSCCIARDHITDDNGNIYSLGEHSVKEILTSTFMKNLRQEMREGKQPSNCETCWEDERNGKESKRLIYNKIMGFDFLKIDEIDYEKEPEYPVDLQIALGSVCNLKCRTCNPVYSSKWRSEAKERNIHWWKPDVKVEVTDLERSKFWEDLEESSVHLRRLEIMGGEPFYTKEFKVLIDRLIDYGTSKNISLNLSTNGTIFDEELLNKITDNFNAVGFNISIDGTDRLFDYTRHGNSWSNVSSNLRKFYEKFKYYKDRQQKHKFSIGITITISTINFYYLRDIHQFFEVNYPDFEIWNNIVYFPDHYNPNIMLPELKEQFIDRVENPTKYGLSPWDEEKYKHDILPIVNHVRNPAQNNGISLEKNEFLWHKFIRDTFSTDEFRKESIRKSLPEFYKLISNHTQI